MKLTQAEARKLGYLLYEGSYIGGNSDVAGTWYWAKEGEAVEMSGRGFPTKKSALEALQVELDQAKEAKKGEEGE